MARARKAGTRKAKGATQTKGKPRAPAKPKKEPRTPLLAPKERAMRAKEVPKWSIRGQRLVREWTLKDFDAAIALVDAVAALARRADHHPDLHLTDYRKVRVETWSHDAGGLSVRDFSLAQEIDRFPEAVEPPKGTKDKEGRR